MATSDQSLVQPSPDHRRAHRQRVLLAGKLVYGEADLTIDCTIRNLSPTGAKVKTAGPVALPSRLHLIEVKTGQAFDCEVAWRRTPEIGLRFLHTYDLPNNDTRELRILKRVWVEAADRSTLP